MVLGLEAAIRRFYSEAIKVAEWKGRNRFGMKITVLLL
jgi:hypothetical protein